MGQGGLGSQTLFIDVYLGIRAVMALPYVGTIGPKALIDVYPVIIVA